MGTLIFKFLLRSSSNRLKLSLLQIFTNLSVSYINAQALAAIPAQLGPSWQFMI